MLLKLKKIFRAEMNVSAAFFMMVLFVLNEFSYAQAQDGMTIRGQLSPKSQITLSSSLSGTIKQVMVREGSSFKKGDILYKLDCKIFEAQKVQAESGLMLSKKQLDSVKTLLKMNGASNVEVAEAKAKYTAAKAQLKIHDAILEGCTVRAPYDGRVIETFVNNLEFVQVGTKVLSILSHKDLELEILVPSSMLKSLEIGSPIMFQIDEIAISVGAKVSSIGTYVDATSRTIKIKGKLDQWHEKLLAGMSGYVTFGAVK